MKNLLIVLVVFVGLFTLLVYSAMQFGALIHQALV